MKIITVKILTFLIIAFFMGHTQAIGQEKVIQNVKTALKSGSAKEFSNYFNDMVELNMEGDKKNISKIQAEYVLKSFFKKHPPIDFRYIHKGTSEDGLKYTIGKYKSENNSYRVYLLIKKFQGEYRIDTIDFSKE